MTHAVLRALSMAFAMAWEILWPLVLGFLLSAVVEAVVPHQQMSRLILAYSKAGDPTLVGTATTTAAENARKAAIGYMRHFANEVNFDLVSRRRLGAYVTYQTADEIASPQYRRACYQRTGITDRLSLRRVESARSTSVSVYRGRPNGRFSDRQLDRAHALLPILMASADFHGGGRAANSSPQKPTVEEMQAGLKSRHPRMTVRELQVAARVKAGISARQIAAELGIAETTVITHRTALTPAWA